MIDYGYYLTTVLRYIAVIRSEMEPVSFAQRSKDSLSCMNAGELSAFPGHRCAIIVITSSVVSDRIKAPAAYTNLHQANTAIFSHFFSKSLNSNALK